MTNRRGAIIAAFGACGAARHAFAAAAPPAAELVRTGLYRIAGDGGNTLLRFSGAGIVLVDGQPADAQRALLAQVRRINRIADLPLRLLLLTNARERRAGNAGAMAAARVPLIAQRAACARLLARGGIPEAALHGFDDVQHLRVGGVELTLRHWKPAVTGGDAVVQFDGLGVVAVGDLVTGGVPQPEADGSWLGWVASLRALLQLDFETVVAAEGPAQPRAALEAFAGRLAAFVERGRALVAAGAGADELAERLSAAEPGWPLGADAARRLHAELAAAG